MWLFGYGSLLWYTDFPYRRVVAGVVHGYSRRFWQLSPDHRGTPSNPGRTVTLVEDKDGSCWGLAYDVAEEHASDTIKYLNEREKAGYLRKEVEFHPDDGSPSFYVNVYLAALEQNPYYTGPTDDSDVVETIMSARGRSGTNIEYALRLAQCVHRLAPHFNDEYLFGIEQKILDNCRQLNVHDDCLAECVADYSYSDGVAGE